MNTVASDFRLNPANHGMLSGSFAITISMALALHAGLLLIHFKNPPRPYEEPNLDITLLQPADNQAQLQSTPEWQPDLIPIPQPQEDPVPEIVTTTTPKEPAPTLVNPTAEQAPIIDETEPAISASALRHASLSAMRALPEIQLAPESVRHKYVSTNTQDMRYRSYMRAWVDKVERVGNMNYPEEARRQGLFGTLRVSVGVHPDGSLGAIEILQSSGFAVLDDAAIRIVELSAPFAALPEEITNETDILHITRTWRFTPDQGLVN